MPHVGKKEAARTIAKQMRLPSGQLQTVNKAISSATASSAIMLQRYGDKVIVYVTRHGKDGGVQVFGHIVAPNGKRVIIQRAYDALGRLVHYDIKHWGW